MRYKVYWKDLQGHLLNVEVDAQINATTYDILAYVKEQRPWAKGAYLLVIK